MKILVLGATGGTGSAFVRAALSRGYGVRAMVRREPARDRDPRIEWMVGDVKSMAHVNRALDGCDALVSCLGQRSASDAGVLGESAEAVTRTPNACHLARLIVISQGLVTPSNNPIVALLRLFLARHVKDSRRMEAAIRAWPGNWTIVRPPRLTNGPVGDYRYTLGGKTRSFSMSRETLAAFLVHALDADDLSRAIVGIGAA